MKLIVGLGNPGEKYKHTRHNVGFMILDKYAQEHSLTWNEDKYVNGFVAKTTAFVLLKPNTFMNNSGEAVKKALKHYNISAHELVVVHDDVDLELGRTKFRPDMGAAGHHGVEDIIEKVGTKDFWRLRVGVGRPEDSRFDIHDYVLGKMDPEIVEKITSTAFLKDLNN